MSAFAKSLVNGAVTVFFREVRMFGDSNIPESGPVIFVCGPHANQFFDPMLIFTRLPRTARFLAAEKSVRRKYVGWMIRQFNSIPVTRAEDLATKASGKIRSEGSKVIGEGTKFTTELKGSGLSLSAQGQTAKVGEIISDTELVLKGAFEKDLTEPVSFKWIPKVDQDAMFNTVFDCLGRGDCVGIFPEGGSHDQPQLLPLKVGVAIMALGAASKHRISVNIVPVGLNYFAPDQFRSKAFLDVGQPLVVPEHLVKKFSNGGQDKIDACNELMENIESSLRSVTVNTPDFETFQVVRTIRRLYTPHSVDLPLNRVAELTRRFALAYEKLKEEKDIQELVHDVLDYEQKIEDLGIRDHHVRRAVYANTCQLLGTFIYRIFFLIVASVFSFPGFLLNLPLVIVSDRISKQKAKEAVASSKVKIEGKDVLATWKVLVAFGVIPLLLFFYTIVSIVIVFALNAPTLWKILVPIITFFGIPIVSLFSIRFGEVGMQVFNSLPALAQTLFSSSRKQFQQLYDQRKGLQKRIVDAVDRYGPRVLGPEFDEVRIVKREDFSRSSIGGRDEGKAVELISPPGGTKLKEPLLS